MLSPEQGNFIENAVEEILQVRKDCPINEVVPSVLDLYWEQLMRNNIQKDIAKMYCGWGEEFSKNNQNDAAIQLLRRTIQINPELADAYYYLGKAYEKIRDVEDASEPYENAGSKIDYQKIIECYNKAITLKPDYAEAHYSVGLAYLENGNINSAIEKYEILKILDSKKATELLNIINAQNPKK